MTSRLTITFTLFSGITLAAIPSAQAQRHGNGQDTAQAILGIVSGALNNQASKGQWGGLQRQWGNNGNSFGNNNFGNNNFGNTNFGSGWTTTRPKYGYQNQVKQNGRWYNQNDPRVRNNKTTHWQGTHRSGNTIAVLGGEDRVELPRRRVRVQTGFDTQVNVAKIVGDAVGIGAQIAQQSRHNIRRPASNYVPDHPRTYRPAQSYTPSYTTTYRPTNSIAEPKPEPQRNVLPELPLEPASNDVPSLALADDGQLQQATDELNDQAVQNAGKLAKDQDEKIEATLNKIEVPPDADEKDVQNFSNAVAARDAETIQELGQKIGLDQKKLDELVEEVKVGQSLDRLADLVAGGATADEIDQVASGLGKYLSTKPGEESIELQQKLENLTTTTRARDAIASALANQGDDVYPPGMTDLITVPELPEDTMAVTPEGQIIQGTGGVGELGFEQGTVADVVGMPVPGEDPIPDVDEGSVDDVTSGVALLSKKENRADIHYRVDDHDFTMKPGYRQTLAAGQSHFVEFDRGGEFGTAKYQLQKGTYAFEVTSKGWELYQQEYEVTIDNSRNKHDFHYIVNGEQTVAQSGAKQQHTSDYPIVVSFDRGDGGDPASKKLENGTYRVGLDIKKRRIELFSSDEEAETVLLTGK